MAAASGPAAALEELQGMFPDRDRNAIGRVLRDNGNNLDATVDALLMSPPEHSPPASTSTSTPATDECADSGQGLAPSASREPEASAAAWWVLVGGEARQLQGGAPEEREFVHTSLSFVGKAYAQLRAAGVPRSRIITIVQLQDTLRVLHMGVTGAIQTGIPPAYYQEQKANTEAACRRMIDEGGADYDYDAVNPETVWNVLTGGEGARAGKVIPAEDSDSPIFFAIYSHGDSHSAHPSSAQEAKEPHTAKNAEWFAHMPYPASEHTDMFDFVATDGAASASASRCYLYSTQLRLIFHQLFQRQPQRPVVGLLNYCRSGGNLDFMRRPEVVKAFGVDRWPLFLMSSSQGGTDSLVGGFWESFFSSITDIARQAQPGFPGPSGSGSTAIGSNDGASAGDALRAGAAEVEEKEGMWMEVEQKEGAGEGEGGSVVSGPNLEELFWLAETDYLVANKYELLNHVKERAYGQAVWCLEFEFPGTRTGNVDPWHLDLTRCLSESLSAHPHVPSNTQGSQRVSNHGRLRTQGHPLDFSVLRDLQQRYRDGRAFRVVDRGSLSSSAATADIPHYNKNHYKRQLQQTLGRARGGGSSGGRRGGELDLDPVVLWMHFREDGNHRLSCPDDALPGVPFPVIIEAWQGPRAGSEVDLEAEVTQAAECIARPERVFGHLSGVHAFPGLGLFRPHLSGRSAVYSASMTTHTSNNNTSGGGGGGRTARAASLSASGSRFVTAKMTKAKSKSNR